MELLDIGEIEEIVCTKEGPLDDCEIEVRGASGARRYSTCVAISQNRFDQGRGRLWDVRLQYLIGKIIPQRLSPLAERGRILTEGERIPLPPTKESMRWGIENASRSLLDEMYAQFKNGSLKWIDTDGVERPSPEGSRAMLCVMAISMIQDKSRAADVLSEYDWIMNEYAQVKLVLDAYAGKINDVAISGDNWEGLSGSCDGAREMARAHNALIRNGRIPDDEKTKSEEKRIAEICEGLLGGVYNYGIPKCDFGEAIKASVANTMDLARRKCGKRAWLVKKYTPFRYPGTKVVCPPY